MFVNNHTGSDLLPMQHRFVGLRVDNGTMRYKPVEHVIGWLPLLSPRSDVTRAIGGRWTLMCGVIVEDWFVIPHAHNQYGQVLPTISRWTNPVCLVGLPHAVLHTAKFRSIT
jgi:hypothetical protein